MSAKPLPIDIPPGVRLVDSPAAAPGRWTDAQWIRFRAGKAEKIGGWVKLVPDQMEGLARGSLGWTTLAGNNLVMAGTAVKVYSALDSLVDRTPYEAEGTLATDPFAVTDTETTVVVTHTSHGREVGDRVHFSGATAGGGITIDGEYTVTVVTNDDTYEIEHSEPATSTDASTGGDAVAFAYEIHAGVADTSFGLGYGAGPYGMETYGTPREDASGVEIELRVWWLAEYGNQVLTVPSGGTLYIWDEPNNEPRFEAVSNAPASIRAMFVTPERFPVALGTTTPMTMQWPDVDDITDWTPDETNTANIRTLQNGSKLMGGTGVVEGLSLVWSDTSVYAMQYTGSDFVYETRLVGENCGLIAPQAFCATGATAFWMSSAGFHYFTGTVESVPNEADILAYVRRNLSTDKASKICCGFNPEAREVWWIWPANGADEPDHYVAVALENWSWTAGRITRTTIAISRSASGTVIMAGADGYLYAHETGLNGDGEAIEAYIETGLASIGGGSTNLDIFGFVPDFERQSGPVDVTIFSKERPNSATRLDEETLTIEEGQGMVDARVHGRHFGFRLTTDRIGGDMRLGIPAVEAQGAGDRR